MMHRLHRALPEVTIDPRPYVLQRAPGGNGSRNQNTEESEHNENHRE